MHKSTANQQLPGLRVIPREVRGYFRNCAKSHIFAVSQPLTSCVVGVMINKVLSFYSGY
jgi:hypothetical protein